MLLVLGAGFRSVGLGLGVIGVRKEGSMPWPEKLLMRMWACGTKTYMAWRGLEFYIIMCILSTASGSGISGLI